MRFSDSQIKLACQLKDAGLPWQPKVGQYAFDRDRVIKPGSPFQHHVYFFLEVPCFINYFGGVERLHESMVWIPTMEQATDLIRALGGEASRAFSSNSLASTKELDVAYGLLLELLSRTA